MPADRKHDTPVSDEKKDVEQADTFDNRAIISGKDVAVTEKDKKTEDETDDDRIGTIWTGDRVWRPRTSRVFSESRFLSGTCPTV